MKKKIGIITCGLEANYGACLQALSTSLFIGSNIGKDNVELINYTFASDRPYSPFKQRRLRSIVPSLLYYNLRKSTFLAFDRFRNKYANYSRKKYRCISDFNNIVDEYSSILVGSDQVWNPFLGIDNHITLLTFCSSRNIKKLSFSSSFGISDLPFEFQNLYKNALKDFEYISVREIAGANIIKSVVNRQVPVTLDPVFLHDQYEWSSFESNEAGINYPFVFLYDMEHNKDLQKMALNIAEHFNCRVIALSTIVLLNRNIKTLYNISPAGFLWLIHHACAVITDSFHGTAFSIIYRKEFYSYCSPATLHISSRITNILNIFGLSDRLYNTSSPSQMPIDYSQSEELICEQIKSTKEYLLNIIP